MGDREFPDSAQRLMTFHWHETWTSCDSRIHHWSLFLLYSGLSSPLQAIVSNPSLQSSLSNPNLQTMHSSPSLHDSLSSTSLCTSLSSSSLKSSLSSQSLRSSFSSSSLSNQSFQSTASSCSYSSGIGGSRCCSSSSLSCSPRTNGQGAVSHTTSSVRRSQLSPLMVPSGEESFWQQPALSPTLSCITQVRQFDLVNRKGV